MSPSLSLKDRIKAQVERFDAAARPWAGKSHWRGWAYEFLLFGLKQAWACLFGGAMLGLLIATKLAWPADAPLARYDFLVVAALGIQVFMLATGLERWQEAVVIGLFHVVGTIMEIFKTAQGSWVYPDASILHIGGVPLFSGFMYACIGSYMARAMRLFEIRFEHYPPIWTTWVLAVGAYVNFFTHHYTIDIRLGLFVLSALLFWRCWIQFTPDAKVRKMPILLGFVLVAFFIWIAENIGTITGTWIYPSMRDGWRPVPIDKMGAWYLLMMLSFVLVTLVHRPERAKAAEPPPA